MPERVELIGFDLDGTLYPSTPEIQKIIRTSIYQKISEIFDISLTQSQDLFEEYYAEHLSGSKAIDSLSKKLGKTIDRDIVQEAIEQADFLDLIKENKALQIMLKSLIRTRDLDLITGSSYNLSLQKLCRLGIPTETFGYILTADDGFRKSSGEVYRRWIDLRTSIPQNMLYVGDNRKLDIDSPKKLGIRTCIVGQYSEADYQIENILELEELLNG